MVGFKSFILLFVFCFIYSLFLFLHFTAIIWTEYFSIFSILFHHISWLLKIYLIGEGNGNPLQYSCLEKSMDRGVWQAEVHGIT